MKITLGSKITVFDPPAHLRDTLRERLTIDNPAFIDAEKHGRWVGDIHPTLCYLEEHPDRVVLPRGFARDLVGITGIDHRTIEDNRRLCDPVPFHFNGELRDYQEAAVADVLSRDHGVLRAPTGSGKTVIALAAIARRRQPALIVVHTKELAEQWAGQVIRWLDIPRDAIGRIGGGKRTVGPVTIAMVQSLYRCADEVSKHFVFLVVDECHRTPARTFTEAVSVFDCKYLLGLSATPYRNDGLGRVIYWFLGGLVHQVSRRDLVEAGAIAKFRVITRETAFTPEADPSLEYSRMLSELTRDKARNRLIVSDAVKAATKRTGATLVMTDRLLHAEELHHRITAHGIACRLLVGSLKTAERKAVVSDLLAGRVRCVVATYQLIGEGFDCAALSSVILATPIKFTGRVIQSIGRALRPAPGKVALVIDYADPVGVLKHSFKSRQRLFQSLAA